MTRALAGRKAFAGAWEFAMAASHASLLCVLTGCTPTKHPTYDCPEEKYVPVGYEVDAVTDCPVDRCVLLCDASVCEGKPNAYYCEACEDVEEFLDGDCSGCLLNRTADSSVWPACGN